ncbi:hypothetical protein R1CP_33500 [Rhodococcus opacus]|uniref:Uncharacterized protein n=1 Tax=Rhodococcus opacus TaxID=37919 RepID=A0A1B1KFG4_RHOOP|nr:hypothetical protein R1CP_33500 [Rhodococcus opacus]
MRNNWVWVRILGVEKTVVEGVEFDDATGCVVVSVRPTLRPGHGAGCAGFGARAMTAVRDAGGGGPSMPG